jgi:DNA-binding transcriptional LysR family regulator
MTLDQLKYFVVAATYQHVGRAGSIVAISPSAISSAIASLSEELGCELFRKKGRRLELTADGDRLMTRAKEILGQVDGLKSELKGELRPLSGRYRLGASHFLASRLLLQGWNALSDHHPALVADIFSMNTAQALAEVLSGRIDLCVVFSPLAHPELEQIRLSEGEMKVVVRKGHPILKKPLKEQLRFFAQTPALIHRPTQGVESCDTHPVFSRLGFVPKIGLYWDSDDVAMRSIAQSERWTFVPDTVIAEYRQSVSVVRLPASAGKAPYTITAVVLKSRSREPVISALTRSLVECR